MVISQTIKESKPFFARWWFVTTIIYVIAGIVTAVVTPGTSLLGVENEALDFGTI